MFRYNKCYRSVTFYINKCLLLWLMYLQQSNAGTAKCYPPQQLFSQWIWTSPAGTQLSAQRTTHWLWTSSAIPDGPHPAPNLWPAAEALQKTDASLYWVIRGLFGGHFSSPVRGSFSISLGLLNKHVQLHFLMKPHCTVNAVEPKTCGLVWGPHLWAKTHWMPSCRSWRVHWSQTRRRWTWDAQPV